jgi:hypothetical protein
VASLRNPKQERFAQLIAVENRNPTEAARMVGYAEKRATITGSELCKNVKVASRISELRNRVTEVTVTAVAISKANIMEGLWVIARDKNEPTPSRVRAYELCGKELGMFTDRTDHTFHWNGDPSTLDDSQMEQLKNVLIRLAYGEDRARIEAAKRKALEGNVIETTAVSEPVKEEEW